MAADRSELSHRDIHYRINRKVSGGRNAGGRINGMYYDNVLDLIGNTPLISLEQTTGLKLYAKAEFLNPGGSIKDRIALGMIEAAERSGRLKPGMTIIEPTSGNTGIGLALCGVRKGYRVIIVMPENMSEERKKIIRALGAELVLTDPKLSIGGSVEEAERIASSSPGYFMPQQFRNPANPETHYRTTAVELVEQLGKKIDVYVSGIGSGGTLQGVAEYILERNPDCKIVAVEPKNVSALLGDEPGLHQIQGIGDGFIPDILRPRGERTARRDVQALSRRERAPRRLSRREAEISCRASRQISTRRRRLRMTRNCTRRFSQGAARRRLP